ncbi:MAG: hypothetical protein KF891_25540 [Rhizobacter sp.]|nr:hypothetical protein [Rhizobacter sp.]
MLRSAVVRRANKVRSTHENLAVLTEQHFNAGEATWAGLRRWLEAAGLTGAALDEAGNEVKVALYDGLRRNEISDEAEGIVAFVLGYDFSPEQ